MSVSCCQSVNDHRVASEHKRFMPGPATFGVLKNLDNFSAGSREADERKRCPCLSKSTMPAASLSGLRPPFVPPVPFDRCRSPAFGQPLREQGLLDGTPRLVVEGCGCEREDADKGIARFNGNRPRQLPGCCA